MSALRALLGRGAAGVAAEPVVFATLPPARVPNACLVCPPGDDLPSALEAPVFDATPEELLDALRAVAARQGRTHPLAEWPELLQAQWVARSRVGNFPDLVAAEAVAWPGGGASLRLLSRSLFGRFDFGANRARALRWLGALGAALPRLAEGARGGVHTAAVARGETRAREAPGTAMERALRRVARDRRVLFAWGNLPEVPGLVLDALAHGAASAHVVTAWRPPDADQLLREAGERAGLADLAGALLADRPAAGDAAPMPHYADTSRRHPWWLLAPLDAPDIRSRLPPVDVVVCTCGLMQWSDDPPRRLRALASTGAQILVIRSACLLATPELEAAGFTRDSVWYSGRITPEGAAAVRQCLAGAGVILPQFDIAPDRPLTRQEASARGLHGPWLWFMGEAGCREMLRQAGWQVRDTVADGAFPVFIAERAAA